MRDWRARVVRVRRLHENPSSALPPHMTGRPNIPLKFRAAMRGGDWTPWRIFFLRLKCLKKVQYPEKENEL